MADLVAALGSKATMRPYIEPLGVALPRQYCQVTSVDEIDFAALPPKVVVKPGNLACCLGVMLFDGNRELFSGDKCKSLTNYVRERVANSTWPIESLIVEELLSDFDPAYLIPRDFKVYVAGGRAHYIQVIDRNGPKEGWSHTFYVRDWREIPVEFVDYAYRKGVQVARPPKLQEMLDAADLIASKMRCFVRLDFYMTPTGPVLGEVTFPTPINLTEFGAALFCGLLNSWPDASDFDFPNLGVDETMARDPLERFFEHYLDKGIAAASADIRRAIAAS